MEGAILPLLKFPSQTINYLSVELSSFVNTEVGLFVIICYGPPWRLSGKESACSAGDMGLILGSEISLEKEVTTHSSILAWKIPWTEEPSGL